MSKFITLTLYNGDPMLVNIDAIVVVREDRLSGRSFLVVTSGGGVIYTVQETMDEIKQLVMGVPERASGESDNDFDARLMKWVTTVSRCGRAEKIDNYWPGCHYFRG
jgi:hypothetical protein